MDKNTEFTIIDINEIYDGVPVLFILESSNKVKYLGILIGENCSSEIYHYIQLSEISYHDLIYRIKDMKTTMLYSDVYRVIVSKRDGSIRKVERVDKLLHSDLPESLEYY